MRKYFKSITALVLALVLMSSFAFAQNYTVKEGDVLWKVAKSLGVSLSDLKKANNLDNPNRIHPGQTLKIPGTTTSNAPKYIFYMIGDGMGAAQRELAELYMEQKTGNKDYQLTMNTFNVAGVNSTYCANTLITDSAAAGTALASGVKTNKGVIGQDANGKNVKTLVEAAEEKGWATGLISTTRLTHATPAVFASHNISRGNENEIAVDFLSSGVDFFAGGGARYFVPQNFTKIPDAAGKTIKSKRKDDRDLMAEFAAKGYEVFYGVDGTKSFNTTNFKTVKKVFAPLTYSHLPYEVDRVNSYKDIPSLAQLTEAGIDVLSQDPDGFFMMVEGGRIDHACHGNDAAGALFDTLAFDDAVKSAFKFYQKHPEETLIVVVGDHETGGLGMGFDLNGYFLDPAVMSGAKVSIADKLLYEELKYEANGDKAAYKAMIADKLGLTNLTAEETALLDAGFAKTDAGESTGYYEYNAAGMAVSQIVASRMNINWTTTIHTATSIPFTVQGVGADQFNGYIDNTDIALTLADLMDVNLSK